LGIDSFLDKSGVVMSLSKRGVEMLLDLVDNKLTSMQIIDREDAREKLVLEECRRTLQAVIERKHHRAPAMPFPGAQPAAHHDHHLSA
jgi:hypothetical protein